MDDSTTRRWIVVDALPGRQNPDAAEQPAGQVDPDTLVVEIDRLGAWVRVDTPDGQRWWVDGRRLQEAPESEPPPEATSPPEAEPPPEVEPQAGAEPPPPPPPSPVSARRWPRSLLAVAAVAAVLLVGGAVVMLAGETGPPTVLRGSVLVDFSPTVLESKGFHDSGSTFGYAAGDGTVVGVFVFDGEVSIDPHEGSEPIQAVALTNTDVGAAALTAASQIVAFDTGSGEVTAVVQLPADCCASVLLQKGNGRLVVFPERSGRSEAYWEVDLEQGTWDEYSLATPISVTAAVELDGLLYAGHTTGLTVLSLHPDCRQEIASYDIPTVALSLVLTDEVISINALDIEGRAIAVVDPLGPSRDVGGCGFMKVPELLGVIGLDEEIGLNPSGYQPTLATVGTTAYVIDRQGFVSVVDITMPIDAVDDRALGLIPISNPRPPDGASLASLLDVESGLWSVLVADPAGNRLWWIASTGEHSPSQTFDLSGS